MDLKIELESGGEVEVLEEEDSMGIIRGYAISHNGERVKSFSSSEVQDAMAWAKGYAAGVDEKKTQEHTIFTRLVSRIKRLTP